MLFIVESLWSRDWYGHYFWLYAEGGIGGQGGGLFVFLVGEFTISGNWKIVARIGFNA